MTDSPTWLTTKQAGRELGVSPGRIRQFIIEGRLNAQKGRSGRDLMIKYEDLEPLRVRRHGHPFATVPA